MARARTIFEWAAAFVNEVALLAEEVDPVVGELLGNFPQAFSHIGLVNAAWAISETEARRQKSPAENAPGTSGPSDRTPA
jgi:GH15 family glucan-1,4-alpha-glucosidase